MSEQDAFQIFDMIFKDIPKPTKHYNLRLDDTNLENKDINFNDILINIFFNGLKEQYDLINKYIQSLGYTVVFNYEYDNNIPINIKVWFEPL